MRIDHRHLDDVESLPQDCFLPPEQMAEPWAGICNHWFQLTDGDDWDDRRLPGAASVIYGIPLPEQMPRPGQVAGWTHREWIGWATAHGFEEVPRSKHAYQYRHRLAPFLLLSMSSSPGDFRWSMATATDFRFAVLSALGRLGGNLYVAVMTVACAIERHPSTAARERLRLLRQDLLRHQDADAALLAVASQGDIAWESFNRIEPDADTVARIRALVGTLQQTFALSPRAALRRCGYGQDEAALLAKRLAASAASDLLPGELELQLQDLVDDLADERDHAEQAEELARQRREAEAAGSEPPAPAAPAPVEPSREAAARLGLRRALEGLRVRAAEAERLVEQAAAEAAAALEASALAPAEELERLRGEIAALRARAEAAEAELERLRAGKPVHAPRRKAAPAAEG
jgi:hypothetical protein